jgi:hypothetical protein
MEVFVVQPTVSNFDYTTLAINDGRPRNAQNGGYLIAVTTQNEPSFSPNRGRSLLETMPALWGTERFSVSRLGQHAGDGEPIARYDTLVVRYANRY